MSLRPIATPTIPMIASGPSTIIQPLFLVASFQAGLTGAGAATPDAAIFTFPGVAPGQIWQGILNCAAAPDTALFSATTGADNFGTWRSSNSWGPIQLQGGNQLIVTATGLVPGTTYVMTFQGSAIVNGIPDILYPSAYADAVTTSTEQIFLAGPIKPFSAGNTAYIWINPLWRSLWVVVANGSIPTLTGDQSGLGYNYFTPPYLDGPAVMFRFPLITGLDTSVQLIFDDTTTIWYGADLANIDAVAYNAGGGAAIVFYKSLTGPGESVTPGALTQAGQLEVTDVLTADAALVLQNGAQLTNWIQTGAGDPLTLAIAPTAPYALYYDTILGGFWVCVNTGGGSLDWLALGGHDVAAGKAGLTFEPSGLNLFIVSLFANQLLNIGNAKTDQIDINALVSLVTHAATTTINASTALTFNIANAQVSGGTLGGVIAGLVALGLFTS